MLQTQIFVEFPPLLTLAWHELWRLVLLTPSLITTIPFISTSLLTKSIVYSIFKIVLLKQSDEFQNVITLLFTLNFCTESRNASNTSYCPSHSLYKSTINIHTFILLLLSSLLYPHVHLHLLDFHAKHHSTSASAPPSTATSSIFVRSQNSPFQTLLFTIELHSHFHCHSPSPTTERCPVLSVERWLHSMMTCE